jgi:putative transposase
LHHVMARGIERRRIFLGDEDREDFVRRLSQLAEAGALLVYAWALMPNHFHLLVRTARGSLSMSMRSLMSGYAGYFNRRHKRKGHLFQNRFKSVVCEDEPYLLELVRYVNLNPLRGKVVEDLAGLERYPYSGHSALVGKVKRRWQETDEILCRFGKRRGEAMKAYREFAFTGRNQGRRPELTGGGLLRSHGGWTEVLRLRRGREDYRCDERILGSTGFVEGMLEEARITAAARYSAVDLATLVERMSKDLGIGGQAALRGGRSREASRFRAVLSYVWMRHLGRSGRELARETGVSPQSIYAASARVGADIEIDPEDVKRWCR